MIIKRFTEVQAEYPETGTIPIHLFLKEHIREDGITYLDIIEGRETDNSSIGVYYTGVSAITELRSIADADESTLKLLKECPAAVKFFPSGFKGGWFVLNTDGELAAASKDYKLSANLVIDAKKWVALNKDIISAYFFKGDSDKITLDELKHIASHETRLTLAIENYYTRLESAKLLPYSLIEGLNDKNLSNENLMNFFFNTEKLIAESDIRISVKREKIIERGEDPDEDGGHADFYPEISSEYFLQSTLRIDLLLTSSRYIRKGIYEGSFTDSLEALDFFYVPLRRITRLGEKKFKLSPLYHQLKKQGIKCD
jgi:hypothetical protein